MINLKILTIALIVIASYSNQIFAQETATLKTRTKSNNTNERVAGYDLKKNIKCRVLSTETGCTITFDGIGGITGGVVAGKRGYDYYKSMASFSVSSSDNSVSIVSPRDPLRGLSTGQRAHQPMSLAKEYDKSSPKLLETNAKGKSSSSSTPSEISIDEPGVHKVSMQDFHFTMSCDGKTTQISCPDGECDIPLDDCPNGTCDLQCSWSWGATNSSSTMSSSGSGRCAVDFFLEIQDGVCHAINEKGIPGGSSKGTTKK